MNLQNAYYEQKFELAFSNSKGDAFQCFFEKLMGFVYKADFMSTRPWGREGDRKNDGFLKSERRLFQVYAPIEMDSATAKRKITEDFAGAKKHWGNFFDDWVFVHNSSEGLPPHVQTLILRLEAENPGLSLKIWGLEELRLIFRKLTIEDKETWFGVAPNDMTKMNLGFDELKVVLERIAELPVQQNLEIKNVPAGKIEANALSEATRQLIKQGMIKSPLVSNFFNQWYDEELGERLAESFKSQYQQLRGNMVSPSRIFFELQAWAGGSTRGTPEHELAVLTVLAYYFERCDIFESPRSITHDSSFKTSSS